MGSEVYAKAAHSLHKPESKVRKDCEGMTYELAGAQIEVHSKSGNTYIVKKGRDGRVYCNCPGWVFTSRQTTFGMCKHMIRLAADDVLTAWEVGLAMSRMADEFGSWSEKLA